MTFSYESLLVTLVLIVPGFLTSYLVNARTPAMGESVSAFWETLESLFRSLIIQVLTLPILGLILRFVVLTPTQLIRFAKLGLNGFRHLSTFPIIRGAVRLVGIDTSNRVSPWYALGSALILVRLFSGNKGLSLSRPLVPRI